jgi:hypothetical protein
MSAFVPSPSISFPMSYASSAGVPSQTIYYSYGESIMDENRGEKYVPLSTNGTERQRGIHFMKDNTAIISFLDGHIEKLSTPISNRMSIIND